MDTWIGQFRAVQIAARDHYASRFTNAPAENSNKEARLADTSSWPSAELHWNSGA